MNNKRREKKREAIKLLYIASDILNEVAGEEEEAYYNLPESLQESEKGQQMNDNIDLLQEYAFNLNEMIEELEVM